MSKITTTYALRLNVLRSADGIDTTAGGVTSTHSTLHLVGYLRDGDDEINPVPEGVRTVLPPTTAPVVLVSRQVWAQNPTAHLVPLDWDQEDQTWGYTPGAMTGGNYATTSDSRFGDLVSDLIGHRFNGALAVHDRRES